MRGQVHSTDLRPRSKISASACLLNVSSTRDSWRRQHLLVHAKRQRWRKGALLKPLLQALNTLPVCTECERGFSQTNLIASATRNCLLVTTVCCLLFAKLVGPYFAKSVSLNYMKSGWFKDAIQLMTLTVCVLQPKMTLHMLQLRCGMFCEWLSTIS